MRTFMCAVALSLFYGSADAQSPTATPPQQAQTISIWQSLHAGLVNNLAACMADSSARISELEAEIERLKTARGPPQ